MHRPLVLAVLLTVGSAHLNRKKCMKLGHPDSLKCCKVERAEIDVSPETWKECIETPHVPLSCERDLCFAKKRGYAYDDGTVDKEAFEEFLAKDFNKSPVLAAVIKEKCIKGDVDQYGPSELCQLTKINRCINEQYFMECTVWDSSGNAACDDLRDLAQECAALSN